MAASKYSDIVVEIIGGIGIIRFNRPKTLNAFGGNLLVDTMNALRELNEHPDTVFTVLTGTGRFFSSGADMRDRAPMETEDVSTAEKKLAYLAALTPGLEILRSIIEYKKVFVLALNGPAVGGGAAWFTGVADIVFATPNTYLQIPFSSLGLVPEYGSAPIFAQSIGIHRSNHMYIFGRKVTAAELESWGLVNRIFSDDGGSGGFQEQVVAFLQEQLRVNCGRSMMDAKRLQNEPLRGGRLRVVGEAWDGLAEAFVEGRPGRRFVEKREELESKSRKRGSKL